jgi:hypothetical protein
MKTENWKTALDKFIHVLFFEMETEFKLYD